MGILILIAFIIFSILHFGKNSTVAKQIGNVLPFGQLGTETPRGSLTGGNNGEGNNPDGTVPIGGEKPMFLQLAKGPIAGATNITRDGKSYVRYMLRENGFVYEVDPETAISRQLTNTTIPRVYEASFGSEGNAVVLRYLTRDPLTRLDVIKTYFANLDLPTSTASSTDTVGALRGDYLPDNISALSISPDGKNLFYLLPIPEGTSGTIISLTNAQPPKEDFRNSFSEWLPQLLNDGTILLTTKASAKVPGYAYLYNPKNHTLSRVVREKKGLTTQGNSIGTLVAYSENIADNSTFSLYSKDGFHGDEGIVTHESPIPLTTLPEKCAWGTIHHALYCGSFTGGGSSNIPDGWYQGITTFNDTFWMINIDTTEVTFIADPMKSLQRNFDVMMPFIDNKEAFLFFVDKNDSSLWSMRIPQATAIDNGGIPPIDTTLTPAEQKDAAGSVTH